MDLNILFDAIIPLTETFALSVGRSFGLTMTFIIFAWARVDFGPLRMGIAVSLALPVFAFANPDLHLLLQASNVPIILLIVKEIIVGAIIGWIISIPLIIASGAGSIIDTYMGSFQGAPDPSGGQISAVASLFMITSFGLFASIGGFWIISDLLYQSYALWPIYEPMLNLTSSLDVLLTLFVKLIKAAFILAAPILIVMFFSDLTFLIASKFGKKINVIFLAFSTKAMITAILLPLFSIIFIKTQKQNFAQFQLVLDFFKVISP